MTKTHYKHQVCYMLHCFDLNQIFSLYLLVANPFKDDTTRNTSHYRFSKMMLCSTYYPYSKEYIERKEKKKKKKTVKTTTAQDYKYVSSFESSSNMKKPSLVHLGAEPPISRYSATSKRKKHK